MAQRVGAQAMPDYPDGYTVVDFRHDRPIRSIEMRDWLDDPSRPGRWCLMVSKVTPPGVTSFLITDPDVAMEFKLRWG